MQAYKSFSGRVKALKSKLVEKIKRLPDDDGSPLLEPPSPSTVPSPLPSPQINSSPQSEDDLNSTRDTSTSNYSFTCSEMVYGFHNHSTEVSLQCMALFVRIVLGFVHTTRGIENAYIILDHRRTHTAVSVIRLGSITSSARSTNHFSLN